MELLKYEHKEWLITYIKLYFGIIFNFSQVQKFDNRLDHLGNHVTETEKFLAKKTDDAISGMTR